MYVVTFYSFKGGVGRSMALVNVAAELIARKKRVLLVDFDLEAPGLDTFDITQSNGKHRGLLDFVWDYQEKGEVPDVKNYIYKAPVSSGDGELWVMPAGLQDSEYDFRFRTLNWEELYQRQEGFLLMEDLKAQWDKVLGMDYVLIDSRTGHTDIGGVCTRQLPDAVVALFFPNEQNRRGLQTIVSQIRAELNPPRKKKIELHFVMSNVPDLDDEDEIIDHEIEHFKQSLGFETLSTVIHHYDSLKLLEQVTFTRQRPRSRLAKEYRELTGEIIRKNLEDRNGALGYLDLVGSRVRRGGTLPDLEKQLEIIRTKHSQDAEVLGKLASTRVRQRKDEEALAILNEAIHLGAKAPELLIRRAQLYFSQGQKERAVGDLKQVISLSDVTSFDLGVSIRMLREIQPDLVQVISRSPSLEQLEPDTDLIRELETSPETLPIAIKLLYRWVATDDDLKNELIMCLIGKGEYREAISLFGNRRIAPEDLDPPECFNYAMALWGLEGAVPLAYFRHVAVHADQVAADGDPNRFQCLSLMYHLIGEEALSRRFLNRARDISLARRASVFSCWSYLYVSVERFNIDLEEMENSFTSGTVTPLFLRRNSSATAELKFKTSEE